jgi:N-acetylglucosaminyldiphosphoundecaprenol N-acetyl-beta-D-mannosaminyltransferase
MNVLGVRVDTMNSTEARDKMRVFLTSGQHKIFTPNPEMLVKARQDKYFREVLNDGDLNLCDGFGLSVFAKTERLPGVDFMFEICRLAAGEGRGVYLLGSGSDEVARRTSDELRKKFSALKIAGFGKGPDIHESKEGDYKLLIDEVNNQTVVEKINAANPEILFVAFGMGKQEKWIHENMSKLPSVKIAMGVGGSFDYIAGIVPRAPLFLRKIGLEWLYRLIRQPNRLRRIWNATAVFTYHALKDKYDHKN